MSLTALMSHYGDSDVESDDSAKDGSTKDGSTKDGSTIDESTKDDSTKDDSSKRNDPVTKSPQEDGDKLSDKDGGISDDDEGELSINGDDEMMDVDAGRPAKPVKRYSCDSALAFARKIQNLHDEDEIELPPEPEGSCSPALQDKIKTLYEQKIRGGGNLIYAIQSRKDFRNPSIYEKFLLLLGIEERGTNFPKSDYDPEYWRKQPSYADLSRSQREDMAKREKEKKTKVEFVTGTAKKPNSRPGSSEPPKRTKWDKPAVGATVAGSTSTKSIPAIGDLKSRSLSKH